MSREQEDAAQRAISREVRLERLLGRRVLEPDGRSAGRIEEFRAATDPHGAVVTEYVLGAAGLLERLGLGVKLVLGRDRAGGLAARWDQLDIRDPEHPRLRCPVSELRKL